MKQIELPNQLCEEVQFDLGAGATRDSTVIIDTRDWKGSTQADFGFNRTAAWPLLDLAVLPPGAVDIEIQYANPNFPIAEPPVLNWTTAVTQAVGAGVWGRVAGHRITARFMRIRITDTSGAPNNGIYLVWSVRGI